MTLPERGRLGRVATKSFTISSAFGAEDRCVVLTPRSIASATGRDIRDAPETPPGSVRAIPDDSGRRACDSVQVSDGKGATGRRGRTAPLGAPRDGTPMMRRHRDGRVVGGVASGLAEHLGLNVLWVRAAFALLAACAGAGLV